MLVVSLGDLTLIGESNDRYLWWREWSKIKLRLSGVRDPILFGMFGPAEILRICVDRKWSIRVRNYSCSSCMVLRGSATPVHSDGAKTENRDMVLTMGGWWPNLGGSNFVWSTSDGYRLWGSAIWLWSIDPKHGHRQRWTWTIIRGCPRVRDPGR